jgi:hypothetical protein
MESQQQKLAKIQLELQMLKEKQDREQAKSLAVAEGLETNKVNLQVERDAALARVRDLEQQLTAALADVEIARADTDRVMTSNSNLQRALESFQAEREAELGMLEDERRSAEESMAAAHAAAIQATDEANEARMKEIQFAADKAVKNCMDEIKNLEAKLSESRKECMHLRRSLDEAIHRLRSNQEDVIDRELMKNVLLDWFAKTGKGKHDVLEVMASLLHFTDDEKAKIHLDSGMGAFSKVVGAVAAPLPPSAKDVDQLEGSSVREKWVNFLISETDDE